MPPTGIEAQGKDAYAKDAYCVMNPSKSFHVFTLR